MDWPSEKHEESDVLAMGSREQMRQLFRVVADKDMENEKRQHDYPYTDRDGEQEYRDYKKFRTSSKIVGMGEVRDH